MDRRPIQEGGTGPLPSPMGLDDEDVHQTFSRLNIEASSSPSASDGLDYSSRLYRAILPIFTKHIQAAEFIDSPAISAVLTDQEMEQVHTRSETKGNYAAARCLLDNLKMKRNWFDRILKTLDNPELKLQDFKALFIMERDKVNKESYKHRPKSSAQMATKTRPPYITTIPVQTKKSASHLHLESASWNEPLQAQPPIGHMFSSQPNIGQDSSSQRNIVRMSLPQRISGHISSSETTGSQMYSAQSTSGQLHVAQSTSGQMYSPGPINDQMYFVQSSSGQMYPAHPTGGQMFQAQPFRGQMFPVHLQLLNNQMFPGQSFNNEMFSGQPFSGQGQLSPVQPFSGEVPSGQPFSGQVSSGQPFSSQGQLFPVQPFSGEVPSGQPLSGQVSQGKHFSNQMFSGQPFRGQVYPVQHFSGQIPLSRPTSNQAFPSSNVGGQITERPSSKMLSAQCPTNRSLAVQDTTNQPSSTQDKNNQLSSREDRTNQPSAEKDTSEQPSSAQDSSNLLFSVQCTSNQPSSTQDTSNRPSSAHDTSKKHFLAQDTNNIPSSATDEKDQASADTGGSEAKEITSRPKRELYHFFDDPHSLDKFSWYHGEMIRDDAVRILEGQQTGSFLIRRSKPSNHYTLSLRDVGVTKHMIIDEQADKNEQVKYGLSKGSTTRFTSIVALVNYYSSHDIAVTRAGTCLLNPVSS